MPAGKPAAKVIRERGVRAYAAQELAQARLATPHQFLESLHFATCRQRHERGLRHIRERLAARQAGSPG